MSDGLWQQMEVERFLAFQALSVRGMARNATKRLKRLKGWRKYWQVLATVLAIGCVPQFQHDPRYDGSSDLSEAGDSVVYIPIHVENHRTIDALDPRFYITGVGTHALGIIKGFGGKLDRMIDTRWLGPDGSFTITAHYAGGITFVFDKAFWRKGDRIDAALDNIFFPGASWSHR